MQGHKTIAISICCCIFALYMKTKGKNMSDKKVELSRREFVQFLTSAGLLATQVGAIGSLLSMSSCSTYKVFKKLPFEALRPSDEDELISVEGMDYHVMFKWDDVINSAGERYGFNNDYTASIPFEGSMDESIMWVNHEYLYPNLFHNRDMALGAKRTRSEIVKEMKALGGSILKINKNKKGLWNLEKGSKYNKRIDGLTPIPLIADRKIAGRRLAIGTHGNCAGGVTPWGTFLTCEEGFTVFFSERDRKGEIVKKAVFNWDQHFNHASEHYGWVVEVDPLTAKAKKLTSLGRFAHECATCIQDKEGRTVVYSGDDKANEFIYKFIALEKNSLEKGELFVADLKKGKWLSLDIEKQPLLKKEFKDQTEVLTFCREAARMLGATECDRPEDIEVNPHNGDVLVTLTNNKAAGNFYGSILKITEKDDHSGMDFSSSDFMLGGEENKFACPDNITFDRNGNLWLCTDISGSQMNSLPIYKPFKNNGLFFIPLSGELAGTVHQVASAPVDAEFTGISFSPDGLSMFCSVQHPGEKSKSVKSLRSHWPNGGASIPRSSLVQFYGPVIDQLLGS